MFKMLRSSGKGQILGYCQIGGLHKYCLELLSVLQPLRDLTQSVWMLRRRNLNFYKAFPGNFDEDGSGTLL